MGTKSIVACAAALCASPALAAPFTCTGDVFQVTTGQLVKFDPLTSSYQSIGTVNSPYNTIGYNRLDDYIYGLQGPNLIRVNSDGSLNILTNLGFGSNAGDMDDANGLWIKRGTGLQYTRVDVSTFATTTVNVTGTTINPSDIVWIKNGGVPYILAVIGNQMNVINLNTLTTTVKTVNGLPTGQGYGAAWTDSAGRLFLFANNTGEFFEVFDMFGATPTAQLAGQTDVNGNNDGASCPAAPFPNLPPVAQNDSFSTPFQTAIMGNVLTNNGNGVDFDPESTAITVNTTPVANPANGTVSIAANGAFTYTPNNGFYGTNTFQYRITDGSGLTDTATVTITVPAPPIDLVTVKTLASGNANPSVGDVVRFSIAVTNNGPAAATGVTLTDLLPAGLTPTVNNGMATQGGWNSGSGVWTIGTLAAGATATLTLEGTVAAGQGGATIINTTTKATGGQTDPSDNGNDLQESINVFLPPIVANPDTPAALGGVTANANVINAFTNDTLNNASFATSAIVGSVTSQATPASAGAPVPQLDPSTGTVSLPANTPAGTYTIGYRICEALNPTNCSLSTVTIVVSPTVDLAIKKTNTPGVNGDVDQANDTVTSGTTTTYTLTVTNSGPDSITGALVTDTPGAGITCPGTNIVTITGNGVPSGSFTVSNLTSAGIALGTLNSGQSTVLTYSCQVN